MTKERIAIKSGNTTFLVDEKDIKYFKTDGGCSKIHLINGKILESYKNLKQLESIFANLTFLRIHNSYLVNINLISSISEEVNPIVNLNDGTKIIVSRRKKQELFERFELL
jgi:two-component system LytT family response regulator